jgi:two-component system, cell cycle sensor histidine kinase and response regulator CckA
MKWFQSKRLAWILAISVVGAVAGVLIWTGTIRWRPENRVYRIGWEPDPPFQAIGADGQATGLAVELVREAARRRGIRLEWIRQPSGPDAALRDRKVDLWPLITIIPERRRYLHFTEPYLGTEHCFLVRADSVYTEIGDLAGALISHNGTRINERNLRILLPNARLMASRGTEEAMEDVCQHRADAVFVEEYTAISALLANRSCWGQELRLIPVPNVQPRFGVGSSFAASAAADAIREEIGRIAGEGKLPAALLRWTYFSHRNLESIQALREEQRHGRLLTGLVVVILGGLLIVVWLTSRILRERMKAILAEEELGTTQQNYQLLTEQAADGIFLVDKEGKFLLVNSRMCEMLGYSDAEMRQMNVLETYFPDERESEWQRLAGIPCHARLRFENQIKRKDGTAIPVEASVVRLGDGRLQQIVRDITERKQAEAALRESEERFRNMADTAPVMIWVTGPDKLFTFFNKTWLDFTGRTMEQELGDGWSTGLHPEDLKRCYEIFGSSFDARREFRMECRLRRADREYRWMLCSGVPRFAPGGAFAGYIGSDVDITELRRTQEEALSRQKLESLGVLAGGIAHDFNNLLGSILATAELVTSELPDGSPACEGVETIKNVAHRAAEIVRQMMAYAGQESQVFEPLNLSGLVNEMLQLVKVSISKRAALTVDLPDNLPTVRASAVQIRQVVLNLITNASEALGQKDGVISVTLAQVRSGLDPFADGTPSLLQNDHLRLTVSDTGCGMTDDVQARIFDPFFTTKFPGRGLGLAVAQGIIRDHGGTIHVVSAPGQGSRFEVLLPCADQPARDTSGILTPAAAGEAGSADRTVLVVEDEDGLRIAVSKMLRKQGFSVIEARDGRAGVDLFRANQREIDVVLLDLTLPGMTGREVLEELRQMRLDVKVIITTAYSQDNAQKAIGGEQSWLYIRKPYQLGEVTALLRNACPARSGGHAAG